MIQGQKKIKLYFTHISRMPPRCVCAYMQVYIIPPEWQQIMYINNYAWHGKYKMTVSDLANGTLK